MRNGKGVGLNLFGGRIVRFNRTMLPRTRSDELKEEYAPLQPSRVISSCVWGEGSCASFCSTHLYLYVPHCQTTSPQIYAIFDENPTVCVLLVFLVSKISYAKVSTTTVRTNRQCGNELWMIPISTFWHKYFSETDLERNFFETAFLIRTQRDPCFQRDILALLYMARVIAVQALKELR